MSTWKETIETNLHKQKNKVAEIDSKKIFRY